MKADIIIKAALSLFIVVALAGCAAVTGNGRAELARDIATPVGLYPRVVPAGGFDLTLYSRITAPGAGAVIYIEGDGLAWRGRRTPSTDPTPTNPIALRLAALDPSANVIYLARPCQYSGGVACSPLYWTTGRFAPAVVDALDRAVSVMVEEHSLSSIRLVGFSGGGAVAALLASRRDDVADLRSVAGNLDPAIHSALHRVTPLASSLNPAAQDEPAMARLRAVNQIHFVGQDDRNVTPALYQSYARAVNAACSRMVLLPGLSHEKGWEAEWPRLLHLPVSCE